MVRILFFSTRKLLFAAAVLLISVAGLGIFILGDKEQTVNVLEPIYQGNPDQKAIAFAVNVDWGEDIIPEMLQLFEEENISVTFFVTGRFASKFPDHVKQIENAGHEIGNHGYSHNHPDRTGFKENQLEISRTEEELKKVVEKPAKLYAPPYGECSPPVVEAADKLGYKTIMWTVDTVDWQRGKTGQGIAQKIISNAQNGAIILMHPKKVTLDALPIIIEELKSQGYEFKKISQIITVVKSQNN